METHGARKRSCGMNTGKAPLAVNAVLIFLLVFSILASSAIAVPLSRSLKYVDAPAAIIPDSPPQGGSRGLAGHGEEERRRMLLIETNDYDGTGANNKHDPIPRSP